MLLGPVQRLGNVAHSSRPADEAPGANFDEQLEIRTAKVEMRRIVILRVHGYRAVREARNRRHVGDDRATIALGQWVLRDITLSFDSVGDFVGDSQANPSPFRLASAFPALLVSSPYRSAPVLGDWGSWVRIPPLQPNFSKRAKVLRDRPGQRSGPFAFCLHAVSA